MSTHITHITETAKGDMQKHLFLKTLEKNIHNKYSIICKITIMYSMGESWMIVRWLSGEELPHYKIKIKETDLGPTRTKDFMDLFEIKLIEQFPELLL